MLKTTHYTEVGFTHKKSGICSICKKRATRSKYFYQTINPFNKNEDGSIKNGGDIMKEENIKADKWKEEPVYHARCK
jgi:hypothetical protein